MLTDVFEEHRLLLDEQIVWSSNVARGRFTERYADWFAYKLRSILVCRYLFERRAPAKLRDVVVLDYHVLCRTLNPDIGRKAENLFSTNKLRIATQVFAGAQRTTRCVLHALYDAACSRV